MKKHLGILTCLAATILTTLVGCKKETDAIHQSNQNIKQSILLENLRNFNDLYALETRREITTIKNPLNNNINASERGWVTAGADIGGAAAGFATGWFYGRWLGPKGGIIAGVVVGLIDAAVASCLAYRSYDIAPVKPLKDFSYLDNVIKKIYEDPEWAFSQILIHCPNIVGPMRKYYDQDIDTQNSEMNKFMGIAHNAILEAILAKKFDLNFVANFDKLTLLREEKQIVDLMKNSNEFLTTHKQNIDAVSKSINEIKGIDLAKYSKDSKLYEVSPMTAEILDLFIDIYVTHPDEIQKDFIIKNYTDAIYTSKELTTIEKRTLSTSLSVASASPQLWTQVYSAK